MYMCKVMYMCCSSYVYLMGVMTYLQFQVYTNVTVMKVWVVMPFVFLDGESRKMFLTGCVLIHGILIGVIKVCKYILLRLTFSNKKIWCGTFRNFLT